MQPLIATPNSVEKTCMCSRCDVEKFFPSIDHETLLKIVSRKVGCRRTLDLMARIIASSSSEQPAAYFAGDDVFLPVNRKRGIPIGNLTSQLFANVYLDPFDHVAKEELACRFYVRYCDDFVILGNDKNKLVELRADVAEALAGLRLRLQGSKCRIYRVDEGVDFLGYRVWPTHRRIRRAGVQRYRKRCRVLRHLRRAGRTDFAHISSSLASWAGHAGHADAFRLCEQLSRQFVW